MSDIWTKQEITSCTWTEQYTGDSCRLYPLDTLYPEDNLYPCRGIQDEWTTQDKVTTTWTEV